MTFISRILGYVRDTVMLITFGASGVMDAFLVAFRIPNFLRRLFAEGAFTQAFIPVLVEYKEKDLRHLKDLIDHTAGTMALILMVVTVIGVITAPILIWILAPGFADDTSRTELATDLLRITFPYIFFISLMALGTGILNTYGKFAIPAFLPAIMNIALVVAALWVAPLMAQPIEALAWAVLVAGVIQISIQSITLSKLGLLPRPRLGARLGLMHTGVRRIGRLMAPAILGTSVVQVNLLVDIIIASFLVAGSISWLYISDRFAELPVGLIGVALATVLLPRLSEHHAHHNTAAFCAVVSWGISVKWLIALPCTVGIILLAQPVLVALLQYREFTAHDTYMAGMSMVAYAIGLPAFMLVKTLNASFFSRQNTKLPVRIAIIAMIVNILLNVGFVLVWARWQGLAVAGAHTGLALATSLSSWLNCILLYRVLKREGYQVVLTKGLLMKAIIASTAMGLTLLFMLPALQIWQDWSVVIRVSALIGLVGLGALVYVSVLYILGMRPRDLALKDFD